MQIAAYPADLSTAIAQALFSAGLVTKLIEDLDTIRRPGEWSVVLVDATHDADQRVREARRIATDTGIPVVVVINKADMGLMASTAEITDFLIFPPTPEELTARLIRVSKEPEHAETLLFGDLELNTATYQATLAGRPINLTFMEYELLRFFVEHQGRVWSRAQLLSSVWGYDYFGGARTVDVHVRRLRAKLGEERASWINTVRSVGYSFG